MTIDKEQIMIDGVDVGGCRHLKCDGIKTLICRSGGCMDVYKSCLCVKNTDCDYKQLARKTQELEQYKKSKQASYESMQREWNEATLENRKLNLECEELKKELDLYKTWYRAKHDDIRNLLGSYRKALDEIEDFRKKHCDFLCEGNRILEIINKAKGGK